MKTRARIQVALIGATASLPALATATAASAATARPNSPTTDPAGSTSPTGSTGPTGLTVTPTDTPTTATPNCSTRAYSAAEIKAGAVSKVRCYATLAES